MIEWIKNKHTKQVGLKIFSFIFSIQNHIKDQNQRRQSFIS